MVSPLLDSNAGRVKAHVVGHVDVNGARHIGGDARFCDFVNAGVVTCGYGEEWPRKMPAMAIKTLRAFIKYLSRVIG